MKFVKFREYNDWEGETWYFWLQQDDNEDALKELGILLNTFDDDEEAFTLGKDAVEESDVDALVKHGGSGYLNYHNKVTGKMEVPTFENQEAMQETLYKGGIEGLFKK